MSVIQRVAGSVGVLAASAALAGCGAADRSEGDNAGYQALTVPGEATFRTRSTTYALGPQRDASGRTFSYQVETTSDRSDVTPYSSGWFLTKASPQNASVPVQYVEAELVGTFVKEAGTTLYDPATSYDAYAITPTQDGGWLDITANADRAAYPGTLVDSTYAEDGHDLTLPTATGPQTLTTNALLTFAYLIKQTTWTTATLQ